MQTIFNQPVTELIKIRHSVRNYKEDALPNEKVTQIEDYISNLDNPFDKQVDIKLIAKSNHAENVKLGTYGVIKGANSFLVTACENDKTALMALGYSLEKVVLYCTSLGLGTVWLGGTFSRSSFAKAIGLTKDKIMPIVCPVGYEGGKKTLLGKIFGDNSNRRKDFSELFFDESFQTPLEEALAGDYLEPLNMLRIAPSAVNKQPWRALKVGETIQFYSTGTSDLNSIDIGIGLCHFDLTCKEKGLNGEFFIQEGTTSDSKYNYVISWRKI